VPAGWGTELKQCPARERNLRSHVALVVSWMALICRWLWLAQQPPVEAIGDYGSSSLAQFAKKPLIAGMRVSGAGRSWSLKRAKLRSICANMRSSKPGSTRAAWSKRSSLEKCSESSKMSAKSRASARSNRARTLRPASSSGAKVGPIRLAVAGCPGGESRARSMGRLSLAWMMSRQNVASSRIRSALQPWLLAAASRASLAAGTPRRTGHPRRNDACRPLARIADV